MFAAAKSFFLARFLKTYNLPEEKPKRKRPQPKPISDAPVFRDKFREESFDPEFDEMIQGIVSDIKQSWK
jgi:hypothetical protein